MVVEPELESLDQIKERLTSAEYQWVASKIKDGDKKIMTICKCFKLSNDADDFANSLQRLFKRSK